MVEYSVVCEKSASRLKFLRIPAKRREFAYLGFTPFRESPPRHAPKESEVSLTPASSGPFASSEEWNDAASNIGPNELAALYEASATLLRSADLRQTYEAIALSTRYLFGFDRAGLWMYDRDSGLLKNASGSEILLNRQREDPLPIPLDELPAPLRDVLNGKLAYYLSPDLDGDAITEASLDGALAHSSAVVPLRRGDDTLGFLSVDNLKPDHPLTDAQVRLLLLFANYAAAALYNAIIAEQTREHIAEVELRRRLERKIRYLQQIHEVAGEITSLELDSVLHIFRDRLVNAFGYDRAGILLLDPRDPGCLYGTMSDDDLGTLTTGHEERYKIEEHDDLSAIVKGDRPYLLADGDGETAANPSGSPLKALVQLTSSSRLVGVLTVDNGITGRPLNEEDIEILMLLAGHASLAIQKSRVFSLEQDLNVRLRHVLNRESRIASTLQKAFKPTVGSQLYGVRIAHLYRPALAESDLGGDFYDVLDLGEGLIGLVMADVSGKGLSAAARTTRARFALQAYAHEDPRPLSVLYRLNRFLSAQMNAPPGSFITIFYGLLQCGTGELVCASAGHEPPVLMRKSQEPEFLDLTGQPCGIFPELDCAEMRVVLNPGDRVLLYSDGVTEARNEKGLLDFEGLRAILAENPDMTADGVIRKVYRRALHYSDGPMRDDVALLLAEAGEPPFLGPGREEKAS
jgi:serine phosphatase RsbU (regulator of sigma subunit)